MIRELRLGALVASALIVAEPAFARCLVGLGAGASLGGMLPFPATSPWNQDVSAAPVDANSQSILSRIRDWYAAGAGLHPDFGSGLYHGAKIGIPYVVVPSSQPVVPVQFTAYGAESDPGPYRIPSNAPVEGLGSTGPNDRHVIVVQRNCDKPNQLSTLDELFSTWPVGTYPTQVTSWKAGGGAIFDLNSNTLRPDGWTSADAAGLPIFPGLVRYDEMARALAGDGVIHHALRFTLPQTRNAHVFPARHHTHQGNTDPLDPPMGMRIRLKAGTDIAYLPPDAHVIARTLMQYGMILADNGGTWFVSGAPDNRWNNDTLHWLGYLKPESMFEVVQMGPSDFAGD